MAVERSGDSGFARLVQFYVTAQQRMEDDGCPHLLPLEETQQIAKDLASDALARGSGMIGKQVRGGAIARADLAAGKAAELNGPRIPGRNGNG